MMSRDQVGFEKEKQSLASFNDQIQARLKKIEKEAEDSKEEQITIFNKLNEKSQQLIKCEQNVANLQQKFDMERGSFRRKYDELLKENKIKEFQMTEVINKLHRDIEEMTHEQQRMANIWKDESKSISSHYEAVIIDLKSQNTNIHNKFREITEQHVRMTVLKEEMEQQIQEEKKIQNKLQRFLEDSERRLSANSCQIQELLSQQFQLIEEKKVLQRSLDKFKLEKVRSERQKPRDNLKERNLDKSDMSDTLSSIKNSASLNGILSSKHSLRETRTKENKSPELQ